MKKPEDIRILVACEESQAVTIEFRKRGFQAFSCDILPCSGGHPEWHLQGDVMFYLNNGWNCMIAHPPCTYMSKAGARWMYPITGSLDQDRYSKAMEAKDMFLELLNAPIKFIAVENPVPLKVVELPKHSQSIQPYEYGHEYSKKTLLWLKNLPLLQPTKIVTNYNPYLPSNTGGKKRGQNYSRGVSKNAKESSKTFQGIAQAMATQWGDYLINNL